MCDQNVEKISLLDDKYTFIYNTKTGEFFVERYGEKWQDLMGNKFVYAMFCEICRLKGMYDY